MVPPRLWRRLVPTETASLMFDVPGGRLNFAQPDLDTWAEHLTWCYRLMAVADGATIAVQDFGTSPLAFLGSKLLMPHLRNGVAERLGGRFVCLDASPERVTLTPAVLAQLEVDVLVVRASVADLLSQRAAMEGKDLRRLAARTIVSFDDEGPVPVRTGPWSYLLHVPSAVLLAPQCSACRQFHLRRGLYDLKRGVVRNLRLACARPHRLVGAKFLEPGHCRASVDDWRFRYLALPPGA